MKNSCRAFLLQKKKKFQSGKNKRSKSWTPQKKKKEVKKIKKIWNEGWHFFKNKIKN